MMLPLYIMVRFYCFISRLCHLTSYLFDLKAAMAFYGHSTFSVHHMTVGFASMLVCFASVSVDFAKKAFDFF